MEIRDRTPDDLDACTKALAEVQAGDRYPVDWPRDPARWLTPDGLIGAWIAVEAGAVLGHVALTRDMEVTRLFVTPAARGRGLAARLLDTVRAAAEAPLKLEVSSEGTAAIAFYERSGWRRVGSSRARWLNAAGEPALVYHYVSPPAGSGPTYHPPRSGKEDVG
ncbi:GNAT family N-acetyltransferase [Nonomuraea jabiensis]|uniref:Ribosomal protein S18 acetylase RimI-like enzyme n=1 Tax=Nonomuraea jabiensis TaxID=882448 RepID=A0A7W9GGR7_9ACTN|nr:GNAT family N-acetyltransferase [Nonomuraea jabiensis]MBB5783527.1 ribosomal protein S18 acetylase RimI-like enzyme [Nonomuraea jabiensis]